MRNVVYVHEAIPITSHYITGYLFFIFLFIGPSRHLYYALIRPSILSESERYPQCLPVY